MKEQKDSLLAEDDEEEDEVDQRLSVLERAQEKFHRDLEEVIRAILDMVLRPLHPIQSPRHILSPSVAGVSEEMKLVH
ncbi:UNVERIFIED_CONTAM: hypothetical protein K2H54_065450 [Gekko kuhli]